MSFEYAEAAQSLCTICHALAIVMQDSPTKLTCFGICFNTWRTFCSPKEKKSEGHHNSSLKQQLERWNSK